MIIQTDPSRPTRPTRRIPLAFLVFSLAFSISGCTTSAPPPSELTRIEDDADVSYREIDPSYWILSRTTRALDPHDPLIQAFRDRKARDLADPEAPAPFEGENAISKEYRAANAPWDDLESVLPLDWEAIEEADPIRLEALRRALRFRTVLRHPDFQIVELAMAPGSRLPRHALAEPSAFHVLAGKAEFEIEDETIEASVGTTVKIEPHEARAIRVTSGVPLRALWFRWAPGGDQTYLDFGYYLTGTNFHIQPLEATFPPDWQFWPEPLRQAHRVSRKGTAESARPPLYPTSPRASDETGVPWIDFSNIAAAGFFWAGDAASAGHYLDRWNEIARMKGVFQARNPGAQYDFNFSYIALGPTSKYVTHSHATPEFYYVLDGETEWILDGERFIARPGNVYFHSPYQDHEMRGLLEGVPMRAITGSWAPFGDRNVWKRQGTLLEPLPELEPSSVIPEDFDFHRFARTRASFQKATDASD